MWIEYIAATIVGLIIVGVGIFLAMIICTTWKE